MLEQVRFLKYDADQPRDDHGRFTSTDADTEAGHFERAATAPHATGEARQTVHEMGREAIQFLHAKASALAAKARHAITSTRLVGVNPTTGGGIQISTSHELPGSAGHVAGTLQLHPHDFRDERAKAAIAAAHGALAAAGRRYVQVSQPVAVNFRNGPAPGAFSSP